MIALTLLALATAGPPVRRSDSLSPAVRRFVQVDAPVIALRHVRVIDGTGAPPREDQTVIVRAGRIAALGDEDKVTIPDSAQVLDLTGKSVIPGLVMVHEHLFYP